MKPLFLFCAGLALPVAGFAADPVVRIAPPQLQGSRALEKQTETSVVRDYLQAWKTMGQALEHNTPATLDADFVGVARDRLAGTIEGQARAGLHTVYSDKSHDLQIVFYSPEGLSIQMTDTVQYQQQVFDKDKMIGTATVNQRYLIVMTPSETRWLVRVFQTNLD